VALEEVTEAVVFPEGSVLLLQAVTKVVAVLVVSELVEDVSALVLEISGVVPKVDTAVVGVPEDSEMVPRVVSVVVPVVDHQGQWYQS
jgi:hypothetical protein